MAQNKWINAARLRTLPLSVSGIIVAGFLAISENCFDPLIFFLAILTTIGFQILSNFANDYGDGLKGTDNDQRIGPKRMIQTGAITPKEMKRGMWITIVLTLLAAIALIYFSFRESYFVYALLFFGLGIASIVAAIKYTVGKNAYGYAGFGDVFVFLFFGLLSVCGAYFLFAKRLPIDIFLPAFSIGLLSAGVLNLNNMRDIESDKISGKNTLVVKIGSEFAKYYHIYLLGSAFLFALVYNALNPKSYYQFLFILAFIPIFLHAKMVWNNKSPQNFDPELKKLALSTFLFAVLFGLGQIL
jgi:1,4-dihydroxy-2-naphthoate octaprenyltransferase